MFAAAMQHMHNTWSAEQLHQLCTERSCTVPVFRLADHWRPLLLGSIVSLLQERRGVYDHAVE